MIKYTNRKEDIYKYYSKFDKIDNENISDVNDKIVDEYLTKDSFINEEEELYNTIAMCTYMIENNLYDDYFFSTSKDIIEDYEKGSTCLLQNDSILDEDINNIKEYFNKDSAKEDYYNKLSELYDKENK